MAATSIIGDEDMKSCPACNRQVSIEATTCPFCGGIFAKWKERTPRASSPAPGALPLQYRAPSSTSGAAKYVAASILIILMAAGGYLAFRQWKRLTNFIAVPQSEQSAARAVSVRFNPGSDFDLTIDLDGDPLGLVCRGNEFLIGNRATPWGFIKCIRDGRDNIDAQKVPVLEAQFNQKLSFSTVAWNGKNYIGYCDGDYFNRPGKWVFTIHDPATLRVVTIIPAPEMLGGLVWDGKGYWAATRRNTADSGEAAFLYRLNEKFEVVGRTEPPAVGCQGLAWDGTHLWFADVFTDKIYLLRINKEKPSLAHTYTTRFDYLSGISFDGESIWIAEYDENRLHRLNPELKKAWAEGEYKIARYDQPMPVSKPPDDPMDESLKEEDVDQLLVELREDEFKTSAILAELIRRGAKEQAVETLDRMLKDPDRRVHLRAKFAMKEFGIPAGFDRYLGGISSGSDEAALIEATAEIRGHNLLASWRIHFSPELFTSGLEQTDSPIGFPTFARYTITVEGPSLATPLVKKYEARPGENAAAEESLVSGLRPGKYSIKIFIHAQYVTSDGNKILNRSYPSLQVEK
jgi:hypothetical protein